MKSTDLETELVSSTTSKSNFGEIKLLQKVGEGNFGEVYKGINASGKLFALKTIKNQEALKEFNSERNILEFAFS